MDVWQTEEEVNKRKAGTERTGERERHRGRGSPDGEENNKRGVREKTDVGGNDKTEKTTVVAAKEAVRLFS